MSTGIQPRREPVTALRHPKQKAPALHHCTICDRRFTRAFNLRSHLLNHKTERPYSCVICGKAFARHNDRREHEKRHGGEKPFVCEGTTQDGTPWGCGTGFARKTHLTRHQRSKMFTCTAPARREEEEQARRAAEDSTVIQGPVLSPPPSANPAQPPSPAIAPVDRPVTLEVRPPPRIPGPVPRFDTSHLSDGTKVLFLEQILRHKGINVEEEVQALIESFAYRRYHSPFRVADFNPRGDSMSQIP